MANMRLLLGIEITPTAADIVITYIGIQV